MAPSHDMGFQKSSRALALSVCSSNALGPVRNPVLSQGAPASLVPLVWESKTPGWLVQDPTTRPIGDLIPTIRGSGAHPGRGWFLSFGNRTQNSRVAGARPNHQDDRGSDPNHQGIWIPPRAGVEQRRRQVTSHRPLRHLGMSRGDGECASGGRREMMLFIGT